MKIPFKNIYFIICTVVNLVAGNCIVLITSPEMSFVAHAILSAIITAFLAFIFKKVSLGNNSKILKKIFAGVGCALFGQWLACIFMATADPVGSALESALKGAIPLFALSAVFMPFWILFAVVNVLCLHFADSKIKN